MLIECSSSFDCFHGNCYRSDNSSSTESMSSFPDGIGLVFGGN